MYNGWITTNVTTLIGHFWVPFSAVSKRVLLHNLSFGNDTTSLFKWKLNSFSFQWWLFCTRTCFETEAKGNSEIAYWKWMCTKCEPAKPCKSAISVSQQQCEPCEPGNLSNSHLPDGSIKTNKIIINPINIQVLDQASIFE